MYMQTHYQDVPVSIHHWFSRSMTAARFSACVRLAHLQNVELVSSWLLTSTGYTGMCLVGSGYASPCLQGVLSPACSVLLHSIVLQLFWVLK